MRFGRGNPPVVAPVFGGQRVGTGARPLPVCTDLVLADAPDREGQFPLGWLGRRVPFTFAKGRTQVRTTSLIAIPKRAGDNLD